MKPEPTERCETSMEIVRNGFETMYGAMGFDLTRQSIAVPEPWAEYAHPETGYAWAGYEAGSESGYQAGAADKLAELRAGGVDLPTFIVMHPDMLKKIEDYGDRCVAAAVPEGWVLVPKEPTQKMLDAGYRSTCSHAYVSCWNAMLSAAPTPPKGGV